MTKAKLEAMGFVNDPAFQKFCDVCDGNTDEDED